MTIVAAADGSALGNPGPAGWAWYVDDERWAAGGWPHGTNNQGELKAVIDLFESTAHLPDEDLLILCDSQYVINAVTKWMPGWKRKGWRKADGQPVLNLELLRQLDEVSTGRRFTFEWVKGHAGHELNEAADLRARAVAEAYQSNSTIPRGPGWRERPPRSTGWVEAAPIGSSAVPDNGGFSASVSDSGTVTQADEASLVVELQKELLTPRTRRDPGAVAALLDHAFEEIGPSGRLWDREAALVALTDADGPRASFELISASRLDDDSILVLFSTNSQTGRTVDSSVWIRTGESWRLRFHQATSEAD